MLARLDQLGLPPAGHSAKERDRSLGTKIAAEERRLLTGDLGVWLAETRACRQLAGLPA